MLALFGYTAYTSGYGIRDRTIGEVLYIPDGDDLLLLGKREIVGSSQAAAAAQSAATGAEPPKSAKTTTQRQEGAHLANVDTDDWEDETDEEEAHGDDYDMDDDHEDDDVSEGIQLLLYTQAGGVGVEHQGKGTELLGKPHLKQTGALGAPIHAVGEITFPIEAREFERPGPESEHDDLFSTDRFSGYEVPYLDTGLDFAMDDSDGRLLCVSAQNIDEFMAYAGTIRYDELRQRMAAATAPLSIKDWADFVHWDEWLWSEVYIATSGLRVATTQAFEARRRSDVRAQDRITLRVDDVRGAASLAVGVHPSPLGSRFAPPPESRQALTTSPQSTALDSGSEARLALSSGWDVTRPAGETYDMTLLCDPSKPEFREAEISVSGEFGDRYLFGEFKATHLARKSTSAEVVFSKHLGEVAGISIDADHMYLDMRQRVVVLSF
ncbi:uncharacterized protein LOC62_03G004392 [Vanrija pseudolonga]|uniref:Uncharacterized protein n=1 Tax=Vanrija pseudolonga TaxID=143232 RepID=A0AAF1BKB0_9TREE|nr:hypothetical protein LOC62_03G004392 [Vanrija pseudolonga]